MVNGFVKRVSFREAFQYQASDYNIDWNVRLFSAKKEIFAADSFDLFVVSKPAYDANKSCKLIST